MATQAEPLTVSEAQRAIYIDFEGTAVDPPSLLGVAWFDGDKVRFVQYVVEEGLWPAAEAKSPDYGGDCQAVLTGFVRSSIPWAVKASG